MNRHVDWLKDHFIYPTTFLMCIVHKFSKAKMMIEESYRIKNETLLVVEK